MHRKYLQRQVGNADTPPTKAVLNFFYPIEFFFRSKNSTLFRFNIDYFNIFLYQFWLVTPKLSLNCFWIVNCFKFFYDSLRLVLWKILVSKNSFEQFEQDIDCSVDDKTPCMILIFSNVSLDICACIDTVLIRDIWSAPYCCSSLIELICAEGSMSAACIGLTTRCFCV